MVHHCTDCPGEDPLVNLLRNLFEEINNDFIQLQLLESTDRAQIVTETLPKVDDHKKSVAK